MLWRTLFQKSWMETRWRFYIGLMILALSAMNVVAIYPSVNLLRPLGTVTVGGRLGMEITEALSLSSQYRGYVWLQWFRQDLAQVWILFAILLGSGGLLSQSTKGALYQLSMPVSRARLLGVRAATALAELYALALAPSLLICALSPGIGKSYSVSDAIVHATALFIAGAVFFSLTFLLSTVFHDVWRAPMIAVLVTCVTAIWDQELVAFGVSPGDLVRYRFFSVMSAESYFRYGSMPWMGRLVLIAISAALLYGAVRNIERHDF